MTLQNKSFSFKNPAIEDIESSSEESSRSINYEAVKTSRRVKLVKSKNGTLFFVTSIVQEFWLPVSYYEKVMENSMKEYDQNDVVHSVRRK